MNYQVWRWKPLYQQWVKFEEPVCDVVYAQLQSIDAKRRYYDCCTAIETIARAA